MTIKAMLGGAACLLTLQEAFSEGFTDADIMFFGQVRQYSGAQVEILKEGRLELTFVKESDSANKVVVGANLQPTGVDSFLKPFSYAVRVPVKYLPDVRQKASYLSIGAEEAGFRIEAITIDGRQATLRDGSTDYYGFSFANRAGHQRLDLIVGGDETDADADQLPDWWEVLHGLDPSRHGDANDDPDGDGWSNLEEFQRGSNPSVSNVAPELAVTELWVPELGEAGVYVDFLDSNTPASEMMVEVALSESTWSGFQLKLDGRPLSPGKVPRLRLDDLQAGRLTLAHTDRAHSEGALLLQWRTGGDAASGEIKVEVLRGGALDGSAASLWLDGQDMETSGQSVAQWTDRSGHGRHAMQPSASFRPVVSGNGGVSFADSAEAHLFFDESAVPNGDHTVLAAYQPAEHSELSQTLFASTRGYFNVASTTQAISYPGTPVYQMDGVAVRGYESVAGARVTSTFRRQANFGESLIGVSHDGARMEATEAETVVPAIGASRVILPGGETEARAPFQGELFELMIFPSALPEQRLRDAHDYLASKWNGAIVWDHSRQMRPISLRSEGPGQHIIRGGHGDDWLGGGAQDDILSGGPGADTLAGGGGADHFVFGGIDTGRDVISDFEPEMDVIDLSALFWDLTGDAREFIAVRTESNPDASSGVDTLLRVKRPGGEEQVIVLHNLLLSAEQLVQLVTEERIRMGGLSIPTSIELTMHSGGKALKEGSGEGLTLELRRSGDGVGAALDVPLGLFQGAEASDFTAEGTQEAVGHRAMVRFERGETSRLVTFTPMPDLRTEGLEMWEVGVLPHHRYTSSADRVRQVVTDTPRVWLETVDAHAVASAGKPAAIRFYRDGELTEPLVVPITVRGTAVEGAHISEVPATVTIPAGAAFVDLLISGLASGLVSGPRAALLEIQLSEIYQLGNPHDAIVYAVQSAAEVEEVGIDRWLAKATGGGITSMTELEGPEVRRAYLWAYASGATVVNDQVYLQAAPRIGVTDGRPEIRVDGARERADLRWGVEGSSDLRDWREAAEVFVQTMDAQGVRFVGREPVSDKPQDFYRVILNLDPGTSSSAAMAHLVSSEEIGIDGHARWKADPLSGDLVTTLMPGEEVSRLIARVTGPNTLTFEMATTVGSGTLSFFVDGVLREQSREGARVVSEWLGDSRQRLVMWEFRSEEGGEAVIRKLAP